MKNNSVKISEKTRAAYEEDRLRSHDPEKLPIENWEHGTVGKYYRPVKSHVSARIDNDVLDWLKSKSETGYLTRINEVLREKMLDEMRAERREAIRQRKQSPSLAS